MSDTTASTQPESASASLESRISKSEPSETPAAPEAAQPAAEKQEDDISSAQNDGAGPLLNGSGLQEPEYDVNVKLSDLQADPNNPLYSIKSFEELNIAPEILKGIYSMNFRKPSKIQERALPLLLRDPPSNLIGQSQSGTGKTAAFTLNMLTRVDTSTRDPQALVLAPSRELARQIMGVVQSMGQFVPGLEVVAAIPDPSRRGQRYEGQIVVGTPGTVMDMIRKRLLNASKMKVLVLDEADNMLDQQGLGDQCKRVKMYVREHVGGYEERAKTYAGCYRKPSKSSCSLPPSRMKSPHTQTSLRLTQTRSRSDTTNLQLKASSSSSSIAIQRRPSTTHLSSSTV